MRIKTLAYAVLALAVSMPGAALAAATVTASISAPQAGAPAGSTVQVTCTANGTSNYMGTTQLVGIVVSTTSGAISPAQIPGTGATTFPCATNASYTCSTLQGTVNWTTPAAASTETVTCTAQYQVSSAFGGTSTGSVAGAATITTVAPAKPPPVVDVFPAPGAVIIGGAAKLSVTAHDAVDAAAPLTFAWHAAAGTLTPDPANPASALWTAPAVPGGYDVTVDVTSANGTTSVTQTIPVVLAAYQASLSAPVGAPRRLAVSATGDVFAVDAARGALLLLTKQGQLKGFTTLPGRAVAVAAGPGLLFVSTADGRIYKVDAVYGTFLGEVPLAGGPFIRPLGLAYDASRMILWVADTEAGVVRRIRPDGTTVSVINAAGALPLSGPVDVALDASGNRAWVAVISAKSVSELVSTDPPQAANILHGYDLDGNYVTSTIGVGGGAGQVSRAGGVTVDGSGKVYVSDTFQGVVQVMSRGGAAVATLGTYGDAAGQLHTPTGLAVLGNGDLAVANTGTGRVDRFGTGQPLPTCPGDSDCDGLPDWWELRYGLNPNFAGDALLDKDRDGLTNLQELALGTDPSKWDTDGDGYSDGQEVASGYNPLDPNDHRPVLVVTGPAETDPGLVNLSNTASGAASCTVAWKQLSGPATLTLKPSAQGVSFVARQAGTYGLQGVATCGAAASQAVSRSVVVHDVAPLADAGRIFVTQPGHRVDLSGAFSSDANGDALSFTWDQVLGAPLVGIQGGVGLAIHARGPGLYAFQLTATDPGKHAGVAEVPVLVAGDGLTPTAVAAASPAAPVVGAEVSLDASASYAAKGAQHVWNQLAGPSVVLSGTGAVKRFVPPAAGHYAFEVSILAGALRSPPARVDLYVAAPGAGLPVAKVSAPAVADVGTAVALDGSASVGSSLTYAWRQVSGPAAGLTRADGAVATAVPFAPGWYVFELSVSDPASVGAPVRVAFEARSGGKGIPVARAAAAPATAMADQLVVLDGKASTGASRFRWTQVEGPWVPLRDATAATTLFQPQVAGLYAFELEVDDGAVRSAPVRVNVLVLSRTEKDR